MNEFLPMAFYFQLSFSDETAIDSIVFKELSGISMEMNTDGISDNSFKHRVPISAKLSNLVLKRGMASKYSEIIIWCNKILGGNPDDLLETKTIIINLLDNDGTPLKSWIFTNAYPVKWIVSNVDNNMVIESVEFAYSYFR